MGARPGVFPEELPAAPRPEPGLPPGTGRDQTASHLTRTLPQAQPPGHRALGMSVQVSRPASPRQAGHSPAASTQATSQERAPWGRELLRPGLGRKPAAPGPHRERGAGPTWHLRPSWTRSLCVAGWGVPHRTGGPEPQAWAGRAGLPAQPVEGEQGKPLGTVHGGGGGRGAGDRPGRPPREAAAAAVRAAPSLPAPSPTAGHPATTPGFPHQARGLPPRLRRVLG